MKEAVQETINSQLAEVGYTENLVKELDSLVDANGKVKAGYEDRVKFILNQLNQAYGTEYEIINGEIKNYKILKDSIYETIEAKKAEILLEANQAVYAEAIKNRTQAYHDYQQEIKNTEKAYNALNDELSTYGLTLDDYINKTTAYEVVSVRFNKNFERTGKIYEESKQKLEEAKKVWVDTNEAIIQWEDLKTAVITGDSEEIKKKIQEVTNTYETENGKQKESIVEKLQMEKEATKQFGKDTYTITVQNLVDSTNVVKELSPEQIEAWRYLANQDKEAFNNAFKGLDNDAKILVQAATNAIITETGNAIPQIDKKVGAIRSSMGQLSAEFVANPKVTIDPRVELNTYNLRSKLDTLNNTLSSSTANGVISRSYTDNLGLLSTNLRNISRYAVGGMPDMGEIFMARETGPELVGRIGRRTAVVNNSQIVEAVSKGVYEAVANAMQGGTTVQLDVRADEGIIVKKASQGFTQHVMQTGELPFPVPV